MSEPTPPPIQVVAAVIEREGRVLIGQRKPGGRHALKWEFPGGKIEPGENARAALARELKEELDIDAEIADEIEAYSFRYSSGAETWLRFFRVARFHGEPRSLDFVQIVWETPARLPEYDFLEGDVDFVRRLAGL